MKNNVEGWRLEVGSWLASSTLVALLMFVAGCRGVEDEQSPEGSPQAPSLVNFDHLDHLGERVGPEGDARIIHIYSEAPSYGWVGDDDEGIAAVDDAARAAVVYFRAYEVNGDASALEKAEGLIRFILHMQAEDGLFYNFVWNNRLDINKTHPNSRADVLEWWACRAVWALGVASRVLRMDNPELSAEAAAAVRRMMPHVAELLDNYGRTQNDDGRVIPTWLVHETAADATSELLLGLSSLQQAYPDSSVQDAVDKLAEGIAMMQWGDMATFPFAAHASWKEGWHGWGNSQTQALARIGKTESAVREARSLYSRLLVEGWMHSFTFDRPGEFREFEQIAYAIRCVALGLIRLYHATGDMDYLTMAGLAASWFTGNNVGGFEMYDRATGRGYDGIVDPTTRNLNAGAESTIEALYTMLEVERYAEARKWLFARGRAPVSETRNGKRYLHRTFATEADSVALVMNLSDNNLEILDGSGLSEYLSP